jgi:hypothetical protein
MRRFVRTPLRAATVAVACAAVVAGAAGISLASIPDSSGIIHGCYKSGGTVHPLKVIDNSVTAKCPSGYTALNWNKAGPQGPAGPQGTSGLPVGYANESIDGYTLTETANTTVVATPALPAGSYIVNATVSLYSPTVPAGAQCAIIGTPGNYSGANVPSNNGLATVAMTAGITLSAPGPITVQCSGTAQTSGENITAIPVTTLT